MCSASPGGMPSPSSSIWRRILSCACCALTRIVVPAGAYLEALSRTLKSTCSNSTGSISTIGKSEARVTATSWRARILSADKILARHEVAVTLASDLPMVDIDPVLFEQVLFNVLDNASKYAPAGTTIRVSAQQAHDKMRLQIEDEGDGIPPGEAEHIFDRFHRATKGDQVRPGTGLGLTIARGFIE